MERATVRVEGVVQSVGFRPFVYRTATDLSLHGTVRNLGDAGVRIELEGGSDAIDSFLHRLREEPPQLAQVEEVTVERCHPTETRYQSFDILDSAGGSDDGGGTLPPDTAMCDHCLEDMRDSTSRYQDYWATACVDCGPRFTVIESLPYDRPTTSMDAFPLCEDCRQEYETPTDRRYHAQAIACPRCGPALHFGTVGAIPESTDEPRPDEGRDPIPDAFEESSDGPAAVEAAADRLAAGEIVVVKGIGGAHLVCDATDPTAVATLRDRTGRPSKPFAVLASDVEAAMDIAQISTAEREVLTSPRRPILLLPERPEGPIADAVAPGLHTVGTMLPYSGVHHLLFDHVDGPLVCTSANRPGQPMLVANAAILGGLADVADGFLLHDRRIVARCDDSVARVVDGRRSLVRRSRGFVPTPVDLPEAGRVLALGPELDVTPALLADEDCYLTQYIGDVDSLATFDFFQEAVDHLLDVTGLDRPTVLAHDLHPEFRTTEYARQLAAESDREPIAVQHHHAHAASVLAEHDVEAAIAVTVDGVGYGPDGTVWGGEVLDVTRSAFDRVGGLAPMAMPGGDRATRVPGRMVAGALFAHPSYDPARVRSTLETHDIPFERRDERDLVLQQLESGINTPTTTSAGRFLDAVSALLSVCEYRDYEGEPAMRLEATAARGTAESIELPRREHDGRPCLDAPALLARLADLRAEGASRPDVAATAQESLARGLGEIAVEQAGAAGRDGVALSGGVAYNDHIATTIRTRVEAAGLDFLTNVAVPPGDGGVAYGQAVVAAARTSHE